jgi:hypothetical protein
MSRDLLAIRQAGHWAPSSLKHWPRLFVYALPGFEHWDQFLNLLIVFNQSWIKTAAALLFMVLRTHSGELGWA